MEMVFELKYQGDWYGVVLGKWWALMISWSCQRVQRISNNKKVKDGDARAAGFDVHHNLSIR